jgi:hypothetical protein
MLPAGHGLGFRRQQWALVKKETGAYRSAFQAGEAAERREVGAATPHQLGDVVGGMRPMRVSTLKERVVEHQRRLACNAVGLS